MTKAIEVLYTMIKEIEDIQEDYEENPLGNYSETQDQIDVLYRAIYRLKEAN